jgi:hypothetical protein
MQKLAVADRCRHCSIAVVPWAFMRAFSSTHTNHGTAVDEASILTGA